MELAEVDLREAVDAADGPDADQLAADAHLGLAGVLAWAGRTAEAFEHLDLATELGDERTAAYASLQRASGRSGPAATIQERRQRLADALLLRLAQADPHRQPDQALR